MIMLRNTDTQRKERNKIDDKTEIKVKWNQINLNYLHKWFEIFSLILFKKENMRRKMRRKGEKKGNKIALKKMNTVSVFEIDIFWLDKKILNLWIKDIFQLTKCLFKKENDYEQDPLGSQNTKRKNVRKTLTSICQKIKIYFIGWFSNEILQFFFSFFPSFPDELDNMYSFIRIEHFRWNRNHSIIQNAKNNMEAYSSFLSLFPFSLLYFIGVFLLTFFFAPSWLTIHAFVFLCFNDE